MRRTAETAAVAVLLAVVCAAAGEPPSEPPPELSLLEFLGEWVSDDGQPVDPDMLRDAASDKVTEAVSVGEDHDATAPR